MAKVVSAMSLKIGDTVELIDGAYAGSYARVVDVMPRRVPYATHIKIRSNRACVNKMGTNGWIAASRWRKVM